MRKREIAVCIFVLFVVSLLPLFSDPYHEEEGGVNFWVWLSREVDELMHGEKGGGE